jgi:hypothetical protein
VPSALLLAALFMHRYQAELAPPGTTATKDVIARYLGPLEAHVRRGGRQPLNLRREAGHGLGYIDDDRIQYVGSPPTKYIVFSGHLDLSDDQLSRIRSAGPNYRITVARGEIIAIAGAGGSVFSEQEYVERVHSLKHRWLVLTYLTVASSVICFVLGTLYARRASADA